MIKQVLQLVIHDLGLLWPHAIKTLVNRLSIAYIYVVLYNVER